MGAAEIRVLPAPLGGGRVETGPVQFGEDWPGVFIRGDNAGALASLLSHPASQGMAIAQLRRLLASAIVGPAAEVIKEWVDGDD